MAEYGHISAGRPVIVFATLDMNTIEPASDSDNLGSSFRLIAPLRVRLKGLTRPPAPMQDVMVLD